MDQLDFTGMQNELNEPTHSETHDNRVYIASLLLLSMLTVCLNVAHLLNHKRINILSESAIYVIFGI